jgi:hypothetical protein
VIGKWRKDFFPLLRGIWDLCSRNQDFPGSDTGDSWACLLAGVALASAA